MKLPLKGYKVSIKKEKVKGAAIPRRGLNLSVDSYGLILMLFMVTILKLANGLASVFLLDVTFFLFISL